MPKQKKQRLVFIAEYLLTGDDRAAAKKAELSSRHARVRIAEHIQKYGTLDEAPHARESTKFTPQVFQAALDYLLAKADAPPCTPEVIAHLEQQQLLQSPTDNHNFIIHWKAWLADQGLSLRVAARNKIFDISEENKQQRLTWVRQRRAELGAEYELEDIIFVDETTFEEGPHPKGDCSVLLPYSQFKQHCCSIWRAALSSAATSTWPLAPCFYAVQALACRGWMLMVTILCVQARGAASPT